MYYTSVEGVPQNYAEAARWYRMAAEQGFARVQVQVWVYMYDTGRGVPQNDIEAVRWYRMAAKQGDGNGAGPISGVMYALGKGVPRDDVQAYASQNIDIAQSSDDEYRKFLELVAEDMTDSAITDAQSLSREYWEAYGPNRASSE